MKNIELPIAILVFVSGFAILALEILGVKILAPHVGTTLPVWGALMGVALMGGVVGYYGGGSMADNRAGDIRVLRAAAGVAGILIIAIPLFAKIIPLFATELSYMTGALLASVLLFFIPTTLLSAVTTYAIRMHVTSTDTIAQIHGDLYAVATLGSIAGVFGVSYLLIPYHFVSHILYGLGVSVFLLTLCVRPRRSGG